VVNYEQNAKGSKYPRKMRVLIPDNDCNGKALDWRSTNKKDGLMERFENGQKDGIKYLFNKEAKWSPSANAFILDFKGRVDKPSEKNFQIVHGDDMDSILL